jgi:hypothetical protein
MISSSQRPLPTHHATDARDEYSSAGLEPAITTIKRVQTYALDRTAIGISMCVVTCIPSNYDEKQTVECYVFLAQTTFAVNSVYAWLDFAAAS